MILSMWNNKTFTVVAWNWYDLDITSRRLFHKLWYCSIATTYATIRTSRSCSWERLVLKRVTPKVDIIILVITFLLAVPTLTLSIWVWSIYFSIKEFTMKTYLVKNVSTGEQFYVEKQDSKQYKRNFKNREKQVRRISDL